MSTFQSHCIEDVAATAREGGKDFAGYRSIKPSQRIAITGSSRKTDRMVEVLRALVNMVKERARIPL